jgi:hypothetical protein
LSSHIEAWLRAHRLLATGYSRPTRFTLQRRFQRGEGGFGVKLVGTIEEIHQGSSCIHIRFVPTVWTVIAPILGTAIVLGQWYLHTPPGDWFAPYFNIGIIVLFLCVIAFGISSEAAKIRDILEKIILSELIDKN